MAENNQNMPSIEDQYQRLINARNYHYDNLNKWLITFYAIIGALFVALWTLHASEVSHRHMELCVAIVGYVVSIGAWLSGKGYYYWETNWIMLIHHFEKKYLAGMSDDCRVYSVFANKKVNNKIGSFTQGANMSTSKVALLVTALIAHVWGIIVIYLGISLLPCPLGAPQMCCKIVISLLGSVALTQVLMWAGASLCPSDLENIDDLKL